MKNLKVGSFLMQYYNGFQKGATAVYRIGVAHYDGYTAYNILTQTETEHLLPHFIDFDELGELETYCYIPISYEEVKELVVEMERSELVDYIMSINHAVGNIPQEKLLEHWQTTPPHDIITTYRNWSKDRRVKIIRLFENGIKVYEPFGDFKFWGHPFIKLETLT